MEKVTIELKKDYYEDYLRSLFESPEGPIIVNQKMSLGKLFNSLVQINPTPIRNNNNNLFKDSVSVEIILSTKQSRLLPDGFYYYPNWAVCNINDMIEFYFDSDLRQCCLFADEMNLNRNDVLDVFIKHRKIKNKSNFHEMIRKRDYRRRKKLKASIINSMKLIDFQ